MKELTVWREYQGEVEHVGAIKVSNDELRFSYDSKYLGEPISTSLPLQLKPFSPETTKHFFRALIPEGATYKEFSRMLHADEDDFSPFLARLDDESIGALLFSTDQTIPYQNASYKPISESFFQEFSAAPLETAVATMGKTRLSLSGAMAKVGLYRDPNSQNWYFPEGAAPSTHIVKAADGKRFPLETINEALCLKVASHCGLPAAQCELIACDGEPLIAVERFDRAFPNIESSKEAPEQESLNGIANLKARSIDNHPAPFRLHQEDFCQVKSLSLKYEPTDGNYLRLITNAARSYCANSFGEAALLLEYTFFNYLIGNCDNHLKNHALLYDPQWKTLEVAPLYDVVSMVMYPEIYKEMGVSFGGNRRIDHVTKELIKASIANCGFPRSLAINLFQDLAQAIPAAIEEEADLLTRQGFKNVRKLIAPFVEGVSERAAIMRE